MKPNRRQSFRTQAFTIAIVAVVAPLLVVMSTNWVETLLGERTLVDATRTRDALASVIASGAGVDELRRVAAVAGEPRHQLVRLSSPSGTEVLVDRWVGQRWHDIFGDILYGPDRVEGQRAFEEEKAVWTARDESTQHEQMEQRGVAIFPPQETSTSAPLPHR